MVRGTSIQQQLVLLPVDSRVDWIQIVGGVVAGFMVVLLGRDSLTLDIVTANPFSLQAMPSFPMP